MSKQDEYVKHVEAWFSELPRETAFGGLPARGGVQAALVVLERLRTLCDLDPMRHMAPKGGQIAGLSTSAVKKILVRYGETRMLSKEGGRTSRGNPEAVAALLSRLENAGLAHQDERARLGTIDAMQRWIVARSAAYHELKPLSFDFDLSQPTSRIISRILATAAERRQGGPVAQHLVGAKLELRFPDEQVGNFGYAAADDQAGRAGDYQVNDAVFHVTVAPKLAHAEQCRSNLNNGLTPYLLTDDGHLAEALVRLKDVGVQDRVELRTIETFVGQNLCEIGGFSRSQRPHTWAALLAAYNRRVDAVEADKSLMIDVPASLRGTE